MFRREDHLWRTNGVWTRYVDIGYGVDTHTSWLFSTGSSTHQVLFGKGRRFTMCMSTLQSMSVILRIMKECWHPHSEVRLTALRVKKTLQKLDDSVRPILDKNGKVSLQYAFDREKFHS